MSLLDFSNIRASWSLNFRLFKGHVQIWLEALGRRDRVAILRDYLLLHRSKLFDERWYRGEYPDVSGRFVDPLLHYLLSGGQEGRQPNPVFNSRWYLAQNRDVAASGMNPLVHYVRHGAAERRDPGPGFSVRKYLAHYPDVATAGMEPLQHFLRFGQEEGRGSGATGAGGKWQVAAKPKAPEETVWAEHARARKVPAADAISVDVVIPVYRGWNDTLACLHSVLSSANKTSFEIVVVDDASPEPRLSEKLNELQALGLITLLRNEINLGFVRSCNKAMALHGARDVVLLNSDTVVYGNWLDRLLRHGKAPRVGTVTPFSTNATICSYPVFNGDNPEKLELGYAALDRIFGTVNKGQSVEVPTGVGFCMYVARDLLNEIGMFDEASFGRGYGEENDLCQRAIAAGWSNLLACDIFVRHTGGVSFAETSVKARAEGMQALTRKHPSYTGDIQRFIRRDPAASFRRRVDAARIARHRTNNVLFVSHRWGGGIERHMRDIGEICEVAGIGVVQLRPSQSAGLAGDLSSGDLNIPNLSKLELGENIDEVAELLALAGIVRIHVHSLAGWDLQLLDVLPRLADRMNVPLDFTFHDYMSVCPRINMVDHSGAFCGGAAREKCNACLKRNGSPFGTPDIGEWQEAFGRFLGQARLRLAPSADTAARIRETFPALSIVVRPHPEPREAGRVAVARQSGERLRVVLLGAITKHKGSQVVVKAAEYAKRRNLPLDFIVVGYTDRDNDLRKNPHVRVTGVYGPDDLSDILKKEKAHIALIPSVWPETYCYTLSEALLAGFPVAVFPFGAQYERLLDAKFSRAIYLPEEALDDPAVLVESLLDGKAGLDPASGEPFADIHRTYSYPSYYESRDDV